MKKLEDRCGQLSRDKEELCQALTALKKGQTIAAGPGQTRTVNLMRRVHTLVPSSGFAFKNMHTTHLSLNFMDACMARCASCGAHCSLSVFCSRYHRMEPDLGLQTIYADI